MAKALKEQYQQYVNDTAPDMDMLWSRIESSIDSKTDKTEKEQSYVENRQKISTKRNFRIIWAAAAAVIVAVVGVRMINNTKIPETSETKDSPTVTTTAKASDGEKKYTDEKTQQNAMEDMAEEAETAPSETYNEEAYDAADNFGNEISADNATKSATSSLQNSTTKSEGTRGISSISYSSLAFNETDTVAYSSFTPDGDEYFVQNNVLEQTEVFVDVTVEKAQLEADAGKYTLRINDVFTKDNEVYDLSGEELIIESKTPYILQQNREYLLPLRKNDDSWYIVFENAPQIEITLDGGAVYHNGWLSLTSSAYVKKDRLSFSDMYYDRMLYCDEADLRDLIDAWKKV